MFRKLTLFPSSGEEGGTPISLSPLERASLIHWYDVGFNPSTQRHYRRLIYYLYIHSYMFRSYDHHQAKTETCSYVYEYISNILTYDSDVA
jgi:hypothetical protein